MRISAQIGCKQVLDRGKKITRKRALLLYYLMRNLIYNVCLAYNIAADRNGSFKNLPSYPRVPQPPFVQVPLLLRAVVIIGYQYVVRDRFRDSYLYCHHTGNIVFFLTRYNGTWTYLGIHDYYTAFRARGTKYRMKGRDNETPQVTAMRIYTDKRIFHSRSPRVIEFLIHHDANTYCPQTENLVPDYYRSPLSNCANGSRVGKSAATESSSCIG